MLSHKKFVILGFNNLIFQAHPQDLTALVFERQACKGCKMCLLFEFTNRNVKIESTIYFLTKSKNHAKIFCHLKSIDIGELTIN
jgi:hypothetical protein